MIYPEDLGVYRILSRARDAKGSIVALHWSGAGQELGFGARASHHAVMSLTPTPARRLAVSLSLSGRLPIRKATSAYAFLGYALCKAPSSIVMDGGPLNLGPQFSRIGWLNVKRLLRVDKSQNRQHNNGRALQHVANAKPPEQPRKILRWGHI